MEKHGLRVSARYPRMLAAFGAWAAFGAAFLLIATDQAVFGGILVVGGLAAIVLAIEGSRMRERVYTRLDMLAQWAILILPFGFVILLLVLTVMFYRPYLGYLLFYLAGLLVPAALAARELRRGERVS